MKKTKYIAIAYFIFITISVLLTSIHAKNDKIEREANLKKVSKTIDDFKVLITGKKTEVIVVKDTINQFYVTCNIKKDSLQKGTYKFVENIDYNVHGDTLFIHKTGKNTLNISAKEITHIIAKEKSRITLTEFSSEKLKIESEKAVIRGGKNTFKHLSITALKGSKICMDHSTIDTLKIIANKSRIFNASNKTKFLEAKLIDSSYLKVSKTTTLHALKGKVSNNVIYGK